MFDRPKALEWLKLWKDRDLIKVVTGIRRCGKSTLFALFQDSLKKDGIAADRIIALNFEDPDLAELDTSKKVWQALEPRLSATEKNYVFLDEVQRIPDFEKLVDGLFVRKNIDVYMTGSNAYLLSGELATYLSGRYVALRLDPLSFAEYCAALGAHSDYARHYSNYIRTGGFPYLVTLPDGPARDDYLRGIFNTALLKDVVARQGAKDVALLERVTRFLFDNIGNPTSVGRICTALESSGAKPAFQTVEGYVRALCEAFIINRVGRWDVRGKDFLKTNAKYYLEDLGLRRILLGTRMGDFGRILENVIYLELRRRHRTVATGAIDRAEVDFVANDGDDTAYYQVALSVRDEQTLKRELAPLLSIHDNYPKFLLTLDEDPEASYDGIRQLNALDFLLSAHSVTSH